MAKLRLDHIVELVGMFGVGILFVCVLVRWFYLAWQS
jgi:hypothetical protein